MNLHPIFRIYIFSVFVDSSSTVWFIPFIFALATFYIYILSTNAPPLSKESDR